MLARNATVLIFAGITPESIEAAVARRPFVPCGAAEASSRGFIRPIEGVDGLTRHAGNVTAIAMREDDKILPSCVVQAEVKRRCDEIHEQQGRRPGRKETREIKEAVTDELLAKAFVRTTVIRAWLDFNADLLVIDAASESKVENLIGILLRSFSDAPNIRRWRTKGLPVSHFTAWMQSGESPDLFTIDDSALLASPDGGKIRIAKQSVDNDDVRRLVENGRTCSELALTHADRLSFVLTQNLVLRRLNHLGINEERDPSQGDMLEEERRDAEIVLNASVVRTAFADINDALGGVFAEEESAGASIADAGSDDDPLYEQARKIVVQNERASISLVQRHLRIGYNRAAKLVEQMEKFGVVSPMDASGSRRVLVSEAAAA